MQCDVLAVLDTMWGDRNGRAPRFFQINPHNHSGRRLYSLIEGRTLLVTNVCRELVTASHIHGTPDPTWLSENLQRIQYDLLLVCGKVAQRAYTATAFKPTCPVLLIDHPAARRWSKATIKQTQATINTLIE